MEKCDHCGRNLWIGELEICDKCLDRTNMSWQEYTRSRIGSEVARKAEEKCLNEMVKKPSLKRPC